MSKPAYSDKLQRAAIGYCDGAINLFRVAMWEAIHVARKHPDLSGEEVFERACQASYEIIRFTDELFSDEEGPDDAE